MKNLGKIVSSVKNLHYDIKGEAIIADILESGIHLSDIVIIPTGTFKRGYKKDISKAEVSKLNNGELVLLLFITRDGLYDTLPEGLFHNQSTESVNRGNEMANESKKLKAQEKAARNFFLPLENELLFQRVMLELEERQILKRFNENMFDDIMPGFWKLDKTLPSKFLARMVLMLHFAYKIVGNIEMTARTLEVILDEKVQVETNHSVIGYKAVNPQLASLGNCLLGVDSVLGQNAGICPSIKFIIGPLKGSSLLDYIEGGSIRCFLDCFYGFFIPLELVVLTSITVDQEKMGLTLNDATILGYNTAI